MQVVHVFIEFSECYAGIYLCGGDIGVSHHAAYALDGQSCVEAHYSEAVASTVEGDVTRNATLTSYERDMHRQRPVGYGAEDALPTIVIATDDFRCFGKYAHLIDGMGLMAKRENPRLAIDHADVSATEIVDVCKGKTCQC